MYTYIYNNNNNNDNTDNNNNKFVVEITVRNVLSAPATRHQRANEADTSNIYMLLLLSLIVICYFLSSGLNMAASSTRIYRTYIMVLIHIYILLYFGILYIYV